MVYFNPLISLLYFISIDSISAHMGKMYDEKGSPCLQPRALSK